MGLVKRGELWCFTKRINGQRFRVSTGFADLKSAERRASEIEYDIRAGILGWRSNVPSFAEWWAIYRKTYTAMKSSRNRDVDIVAHFLPHFGARPLDEITKSDMVRYLNFRRMQKTASPGHKTRRQISESTVQRERALLQAIFERAIEDGYEFKIPAVRAVRARDRCAARRDPRHRSQARHQLAGRHRPCAREIQEGARHPDATRRGGRAQGAARSRGATVDAEPATAA